MKFLAMTIATTLLLAGCGTEKSPPKSEKIAASFTVPLKCDQTKILSAFPAELSEATTIFTQWEPAPGTDLAAAYDVGGIACSYGLQVAEIGATILWAPNQKNIFAERSKEWVASGQKKIDLININEEAAYVLTEGVAGEGEFHIWKINLLTNGVWIQVGATFLGSIEEAIPLVQAAIDSILTPAEAKAYLVTGCYVATLGNDRFEMNLTQQNNSRVSGRINLTPAEKDSAQGTFLGTYENGQLHGVYTFSSEGDTSDRELYFKRVNDGFVPGYGPVQVIDNKFEKLARPLQLKWDQKVTYRPATDCAA
jgi:hypothetical protein